MVAPRWACRLLYGPAGSIAPDAFGLAMALAAKGVALDVIGSDEVDSPEMHSTSGLRFGNIGALHRPPVWLQNSYVCSPPIFG